MYTAKPSMYNNKGMKDFVNEADAVKYLNSFLTDEMPIMDARDFYLIGKLKDSLFSESDK